MAHTREFVLEYQRAITLKFSHVPATSVVRCWSPSSGTFVKLMSMELSICRLVLGVWGLLFRMVWVIYCWLPLKVFMARSLLKQLKFMLNIASQMGHHNVILEMDAKEVIMSFQNSEQI